MGLFFAAHLWSVYNFRLFPTCWGFLIVFAFCRCCMEQVWHAYGNHDQISSASIHFSWRGCLLLGGNEWHPWWWLVCPRLIRGRISGVVWTNEETDGHHCCVKRHELSKRVVYSPLRSSLLSSTFCSSCQYKDKTVFFWNLHIFLFFFHFFFSQIFLMKVMI